MLYLIRHTSLHIAPGICYGQSNIPLANSFGQEAAAVLAQLPAHIPFTIISSPLQRCTALAQYLAQATHAPWHTDTRLLELHFGQWEMQAWDNLPRHQTQPWMDDFVHTAPPG
ncbi:MAG TPA: histidine phosphatase family protein, partial [Phnomibacter sp.]|nr:histidine phosphatase family protein [Phnomibacter sp.]